MAVNRSAGGNAEVGAKWHSACGRALRLPEVPLAVFEHLDLKSIKAAMLVCHDWLELAAKLLWRDALVAALRCMRRSSRRLPMYAALAIPAVEDMTTDL
jgi:hypothetical protein